MGSLVVDSELDVRTPVVSDADVSYALGLNPGEGKDASKCIAPARYGSALNSRRSTSLSSLEVVTGLPQILELLTGM
ncbi:hypothetical protein TNCV_3839751 [Trichonephila clavipes]|nr:hypothetical protein TNCV_3839751 [Trichonephila clavipes]